MLLLVHSPYAEAQDSQSSDVKFPNPYVKYYPFESVVIKYKGKTEYGHPGGEKKSYEGTETVYIEGDKFAKTINMALPADDRTSGKVERIQIILPDHVYHIDVVDGTGIKIDNSTRHTKPEYDKLSIEEKKAFHERMDRRRIVSLDISGLGKKTGTGEILGRKCDVYEFGEKPTEENFMTAVQAETDPPYYRKTWIWTEAKIPLKMTTEQFTMTSELTATNIEENVDIPEVRFKAPDEITITYDEKASEASKEQALARFRLYKTGKPMMYKVKVEEEVIPGKNDNAKSQEEKKN
ncbi:MAG: hypothetical protein WD000_02360 [Thermodesulfobacteriota bacterium]